MCYTCITMRFFSKIFALALTLSGTAFAGGTIVEGFGQYRDGRMIDTVPRLAENTIRWTGYGQGLDADLTDWIAYGVASVDLESRKFKIYQGSASTDEIQIFFSVRGDVPTQPACLDDSKSTKCVIATTECLASVREGSKYNLCTQYKVRLYINNKVTPTEDPEQYWISVVRHEMGHVLGFSDSGEGPMTLGGNTPFTSCQRAMWNALVIDPSITAWTYLPKEQVCPAP